MDDLATGGQAGPEGDADRRGPARTRIFRATGPTSSDPTSWSVFGTSGHRGSPLNGTFTEAHILAITQAICDYRQQPGHRRPAVHGQGHARASEPAQRTALEVLAANGVETIIQRDDGVTPTPVISRAILVYNRGRKEHLADGIVITPSHNPPEDGGFKYNPPNGGPADTDVTEWVEDRANALLARRQRGREAGAVRAGDRGASAPTRKISSCPTSSDLRNVIDMEAIRERRAQAGRGSAGRRRRGRTGSRSTTVYELDIDVVNPVIDPTFSFMTVDHDGKIRMDCSSPYAMARLVGLKDQFRLAFANDPDADRHGIVTPLRGADESQSLPGRGHPLSVHAPPTWPAARRRRQDAGQQQHDRPRGAQARPPAVRGAGGLQVVRAGLFDGSLCFGGEESAGASFLRRDGTVWTTDKDGLIMDLLAAEITARTGKDPGEHYRELTAEFGTPYYTRIDAPATPEQKAKLEKLSPEAVTASTLAGEPITAKLTRAPGNDAPIGGLKVVTASGWFAARPSGTENIYKIYAESFKDQSHLDAIVSEAQEIVNDALNPSTQHQSGRTP